MPPNDDQGDLEEQTTSSEYWPMTICIIGLILLLLAFGECSSHFSFDGDNNPESNYTTHFCCSGLFFIFLATSLSASANREKEKARIEKMTEEEKKLEKEYGKKKKDRENGIAILIFILFVVALLINPTSGWF